MSRFPLVASAALLSVCSATAGWAQSTYGTAVTLGYNYLSADGEDADGGTLQVETDMAFGQMTLDLDLGIDTLSDSGDDISNTSVEVLPKYWFSDSFGAGAYFARDSIDLDVGDVANVDSYGLEGTYRAAGFEGSAFFGKTDLDELAGDVDVRDFGLRARFDVTPEFSVFGNGVQSNFDGGGGDFNASSVGIGAQYDFGTGFAMFGGYQNVSLDDLNGDIDTTSIGLNYGVSTGGMPVILSGEYAKINGNAAGLTEDADRLSFSATVLFGDAQNKRIPGNAVSSSLLKSDRNALSGLLSGIGF